ncbi:20278_t:CDS:2, partial [Funneliformis geosporum]
GEFEPNTKQGKKIASLLRALKKVQVNLKKTKLDDDSICEVKKLYVNIGEFPALLKYCQSIEEIQENYVDEISQLGRHLSILLKWSVIDSKLFEIPATPLTILRPALYFHNLKVVLEEYPDLQVNNILDALFKNKKIEMVGTWYQIQMKGWLEWFSLKQNHNDYFYTIDTHTTLSAIMLLLLYNPVQCRGLSSYPSEAHVKIQMWSKEGSSRSDFAAVILNSRHLHFPFFIVEFEQQGFKVHKDFAVIVCEDVFELNKILVKTQGLLPEKIIQIKIHVGLINDTSINLGVIRPIFNDDKTAVLFAYDQDIVSYNIQT